MARKKRKDKKGRPKRKRTDWNARAPRPKPIRWTGPAQHLKKAREYPILGCWLEAGWQETGIAQATVAREQPNGRVICSIFVVDHYCLGIKNALWKADVSQKRFETLRDELYRGIPPEAVSSEFAHEYIYGALEYAEKYGFKPHYDYHEASKVLFPADHYPRTDEIEFGKDGQPFYISGPYDNPDQIRNTLMRTAGEGNFNFIMALDDPPAGFFEDDL